MVTVSKDGVISLTRGDSFSIPLFINNGTALKPERRILDDKDEVYMGIMEPNQPFECALIKKKFTKADTNAKGDIVIKLYPDDTACVLPGKYYYQVKAKLYRADNDNFDVNTIIDKKEFFIME